MTTARRLAELGMVPALAKELTQFDPSGVLLHDDFLGPTLSTRFVAVAGSDSPAGAAINPAIGGTLRLTTGDSNVSLAADGIQVSGELNWRASNGGLSMIARLQISAIAAVQFFVGLTDQRSALEMPVTVSGGTYTTVATDAVGFLFDTGATAATIKLVGVANDVDAVMQDTGNAWAATTYTVFEVDVSTTGVATFFINGTQVGTGMAGAVTPSVALVPAFVARSLAANSKTVDVDYTQVTMNR